MISLPKFRPIVILAVMTGFINLNSHNAFSETVEEDGQHHLDYDTLSHTLTLKRLRAGNHGGSTDGINRYYFKVTLIGLIDEESQHILEFDKKNKFIERIALSSTKPMKVLKKRTQRRKINSLKYS